MLYSVYKYLFMHVQDIRFLKLAAYRERQTATLPTYEQSQNIAVAASHFTANSSQPRVNRVHLKEGKQPRAKKDLRILIPPLPQMRCRKQCAGY